MNLKLFVDLLAVVGALYAAARLALALTPIARTDEAVGTAPKWMRLLAKVMGLDLRQGLAVKSQAPPAKKGA